jgi:hypothetical protein
MSADERIIEYENRVKSSNFIKDRLRERSTRTLSAEARRAGYSLAPISISRFTTDGLPDLRLSTASAVSYLFQTSPNEIAEMIGLWTPPKSERDPRITRLLVLLDQLNPEDREQFLEDLDLRVDRASRKL